MSMCKRFTCTEFPMETPGLVTHFRKHLSVTFCKGREASAVW